MNTIPGAPPSPPSSVFSTAKELDSEQNYLAEYAEQIRHANYVEPGVINPLIPMKGPCNRQTGYGNHFIDLVLAMLRQGARISLSPYFVEPPLPPEFLATMVDPYPYSSPIGIVLANPFRLERVAPYSIGISTWETTRLPPEDFDTPLEALVDELIVPCKTNVDTFKELAPSLDVHYVPEHVDTEFFSYRARDWGEPALRIGMFGALTYRKGIDIAIDAFVEAFGGDPLVELHLGTTFYELPHFSLLPETYPNIHVHNFGWSTREQVRDFYYSLHALFAPFRGEGFYLPGAEFMATGGLLIAPNKMGVESYHTAATGYVIPSEFSQVDHWGEHHGAMAWRFGEWLAYDLDEVVSSLHEFVNDSTGNKSSKSQQAADQIPFLLNADHNAQKVIDIFLEAYAKR